MAYMSQENKKRIVALAKPILKKYGIKATFGVDNHSSLVCHIKSGKLDLIGNYCQSIAQNHRMDERHRAQEIEYTEKRKYVQVNHYYIPSYFTGEAEKFLSELSKVMHDGNHDNSDPMTDYFDVGWYVNIHIGRWNKPYEVEA